jgi:hypothetical protein
MKRSIFIAAILALTMNICVRAQEAPQTPPPPPPAGGQAPAPGGMQRPPKTPEERATEQTTRMKKALLLDQGQYDKVYAINMDINKQMQEKMVKGDRAANMATRQSLETERQTKIMEVLNQPQKEKYQKMIDEEKARMQQRMQQNGGQQTPPPPAPKQ